MEGRSASAKLLTHVTRIAPPETDLEIMVVGDKTSDLRQELLALDLGNVVDMPDMESETPHCLPTRDRVRAYHGLAWRQFVEMSGLMPGKGQKHLCTHLAPHELCTRIIGRPARAFVNLCPSLFRRLLSQIAQARRTVGHGERLKEFLVRG